MTGGSSRSTGGSSRSTGGSSRSTGGSNKLTRASIGMWLAFDELPADIAGLREQVTHDITDLRETVALYHYSVVGHGIQFSEVQRRMLRVERHLGLPPLEPGGRIP